MNKLLLTILFLMITAISIPTNSVTGQPMPNSPRQLPKTFRKTKDNKNQYQSQGLYHSTYILLNIDSSFVYYNIFEVGYNLTIGKYYIKDNIVTLNWDSVKTYQAVEDINIYKKYFQYRKPKPFKIAGAKYKVNKNSLHYIYN